MALSPDEEQEVAEAPHHPGFAGFREYAINEGIGDAESLGQPEDWLPHWRTYSTGYDAGQQDLHDSFDIPRDADS